MTRKKTKGRIRGNGAGGFVRPPPRIALQIEKNRAHGRALLKGIADYALECTPWRLELVDPQRLTSAADASRFDGLIVRVMDDATAAALVRAKRPVVDTYGRLDDNPLASIRLDDAAIAEAFGVPPDVWRKNA